MYFFMKIQCCWWPNTLHMGVSLKFSEHHCLINSSLTWWQERQKLICREKLDSVHEETTSLSPFRQGYCPLGSETTKSPMRRNESLFFALLNTFPNWELLASCKHKRQPSVSETGKVSLEAQLFHGKAIWSRAMSPKACLKCSFQNTFLDSFSQSQKGFNLSKALQNSALWGGINFKVKLPILWYTQGFQTM